MLSSRALSSSSQPPQPPQPRQPPPQPPPQRAQAPPTPEPIPSLTTPPPGAGGKKPLIDKRVWPIAVSSLLMGTGVGILFPVMPVFAKDLGLSPSEFGLVVSVIGLTRLACNVPAAWASDRFGRRSTLIGGPILSAIGMGFTATASSLNELIAFRFLTGVGGSLQMTGAQMYLSDISTPANRARTMAPMGMAFAAGATIGPGLGGLMSDTWGVRAPFTFVACAIGLVSFTNYFNLPETRTKAVSGKPLWEEFKSTVQQWGPLLRDKNMRAVVLMHGAYWSVASGCTWSLLPLLAHSQFNMSTSSLGGMFALMSVVGIVLMGPAAWISDKFGRKKVIPPAMVLVAASLCAMPHVSSHEELLALAGLYSVGATLFQSTPSAFVADISTEDNRAQALAMLRSAGDAGLVFGAGSLGLLSQMTSNATAFALASGVLVLAGTNFVWTAVEPRFAQEKL
jgi:DHA1 family multidrug resistance protein-like MFS transporter